MCHSLWEKAEELKKTNPAGGTMAYKNIIVNFGVRKYIFFYLGWLSDL